MNRIYARGLKLPVRTMMKSTNPISTTRLLSDLTDHGNPTRPTTARVTTMSTNSISTTSLHYALRTLTTARLIICAESATTTKMQTNQISTIRPHFAITIRSTTPTIRTKQPKHQPNLIICDNRSMIQNHQITQIRHPKVTRTVKSPTNQRRRRTRRPNTIKIRILTTPITQPVPFQQKPEAVASETLGISPNN